jgi:hypothetical protein
MADSVFESASDRIAFSEAVDYVEQGRAQLIQPHLVELYERKGLWVRRDGQLELTPEGEREHRIARRERFTDG